MYSNITHPPGMNNKSGPSLERIRDTECFGGYCQLPNPQIQGNIPLPVQEMESTPGPWYSMMAPVPPFTVRMPATFRITSLGEVQPDSLPVSFTPIT